MIQSAVPIKVTQADIDAGERESTVSCPVALAIRRQYPEATQVSVTRGTVHVQLPGGWYRDYTPPESFQAFIRAFDESRPVGPFVFDLDLR